MIDEWWGSNCDCVWFIPGKLNKMLWLDVMTMLLRLWNSMKTQLWTEWKGDQKWLTNKNAFSTQKDIFTSKKPLFRHFLSKITIFLAKFNIFNHFHLGGTPKLNIWCCFRCFPRRNSTFLCVFNLETPKMSFLSDFLDTFNIVSFSPWKIPNWKDVKTPDRVLEFVRKFGCFFVLQRPPTRPC